MRVELRGVKVADDPARHTERRRDGADEEAECHGADDEPGGCKREGQSTAPLGERVVVVLVSPVEVDVAVLHVCRVQRTEDDGQVDGREWLHGFPGEHRAEPARGQRREHEHRVDL
jgi:hypothetical protein